MNHSLDFVFYFCRCCFVLCSVSLIDICKSAVRCLAEANQPSTRAASSSSSSSSDPLSPTDVHLILLIHWLKGYFSSPLNESHREGLPVSPVVNMIERMLKLNHHTVITKYQLIRICRLLMVRKRNTHTHDTLVRIVNLINSLINSIAVSIRVCLVM